MNNVQNLLSTTKNAKHNTKVVWLITFRKIIFIPKTIKILGEINNSLILNQVTFVNTTTH